MSNGITLNKITTYSHDFKMTNILNDDLQRIFEVIVKHIQENIYIELHIFSSYPVVHLQLNNIFFTVKLMMFELLTLYNDIVIIINNEPYIQSYGPIIDNIEGHHIIKRNCHIFRQTNDDVRCSLYRHIKSYISHNGGGKDLVCIGGECFLYTKLLFNHFDNFSIYSDFEDIIRCAKDNLQIESCIKNVYIEQVNYKTFEPTCLNTCTMVLNVTTITADHLRIIGHINPLAIIVVSCNPKNILRLKSLPYDIHHMGIFNIDLYHLEHHHLHYSQP